MLLRPQRKPPLYRVIPIEQGLKLIAALVRYPAVHLYRVIPIEQGLKPMTLMWVQVFR